MDMNWKEFGFNNMYRVSDCGKVQTRSVTGRKLGAIMSEWREKSLTFRRSDYTGNGYLVTVIRENGRSKAYYVHRLVIENFVGSIPKGMQVNHIDGNRFNNHISNLEIVTPSENIQNAKQRGSFDGKNIFSGKIGEFELLTIATLINAGKTNDEIAKHYKIDRSNISKFKNKDGFTFKQMQNLVEIIGEELLEYYPDMIKEKRKILGLTIAELSRISGVPKTTVLMSERKNIRTSTANLNKILNALGINKSELTHLADQNSIFHFGHKNQKDKLAAPFVIGALARKLYEENYK